MRIFDKARLRLRSLFRRPKVEFELEAELRFHLDQLIEENIATGMPPEEARRAALRIRVALGAARFHVLAQIMKQGLAVTALGILIGLAGALAVNRLIASLLFGVQPTDATTIAWAVTTNLAVAMIACWMPAWRAARLNPNVVLREE
jgi:hypothetical protein